jgi:hypothetical protein
LPQRMFAGALESRIARSRGVKSPRRPRYGETSGISGLTGTKLGAYFD